MSVETGKYKTRRLDANGDFVISGEVWIYDIEAIQQTINTRLNLFSAEYWRDVSDGTPWINSILGKNNSLNTIQSKSSLLKNRILNTDGVIAILEWSSDFSYEDRKFSVNATVLTEYGTLDLNEDLSEKENVEDVSVQNLLIATQRYVIATNSYTG